MRQETFFHEYDQFSVIWVIFCSIKTLVPIKHTIFNYKGPFEPVRAVLFPSGRQFWQSPSKLLDKGLDQSSEDYVLTCSVIFQFLDDVDDVYDLLKTRWDQQTIFSTAWPMWHNAIDWKKHFSKDRGSSCWTTIQWVIYLFSKMIVLLIHS